MMRNRDTLKKFDSLINFMLFFSNMIPTKIHIIIYNLIKGHENKVAILMRYFFLKKCALSCGENVSIFSNVYLKNIHNLKLGNNISIHSMTYIDASGKISIGNDVSIAHATSILSEEHKYQDLDKNIKDQGVILKETLISDNVWIGAGSRILAGSNISSGTIIASGAVVKGFVDNNSIVGGVPAKLIKERK